MTSVSSSNDLPPDPPPRQRWRTKPLKLGPNYEEVDPSDSRIRNFFQAITFRDGFREQSFEELRERDYDNGQRPAYGWQNDVFAELLKENKLLEEKRERKREKKAKKKQREKEALEREANEKKKAPGSGDDGKQKAIVKEKSPVHESEELSNIKLDNQTTFSCTANSIDLEVLKEIQNQKRRVRKMTKREGEKERRGTEALTMEQDTMSFFEAATLDGRSLSVKHAPSSKENFNGDFWKTLSAQSQSGNLGTASSTVADDWSPVIRPQLAINSGGTSKSSSSTDSANRSVERIPTHIGTGQTTPEPTFSNGKNPKKPSLEDQSLLLDIADMQLGEGPTSEIRKAVLFSAPVLDTPMAEELSQFGLLGITKRFEEDMSERKDRRVFLNTSVPFSAFICGVQGSGKSHTLSCMLENCLIPSKVLGHLEKPLSALVLHYGEFSSKSSFNPCEAAYLSRPNPDAPADAKLRAVTVYVSPSNYANLKSCYAEIPGVKVKQFRIRSQDLTVGTMLALMSVSQTSAQPLYMGQVTMIMRSMAENNSFDYLKFKRRVLDLDLTEIQKAPLRQRLDLLESFLDLTPQAEPIEFNPQEMVILDLSCPFVDANLACILFNIAVGMYLEASKDTGKLIAVDEAHKYMNDSPAARSLTASLLTIIRQQRHFGARVLISTQEPSVSPQLIALSSCVVIHRFTSPDWFRMLRKHITYDADVDSESGPQKEKSRELLNRILSLGTGQAVLYAPEAVLGDGRERLRGELVLLHVRKRLTWDGGASIMAAP